MSDTIPMEPVNRPLQLRDPLVGARLGEYEVIEPIGEGGMGVVYRALHPIIKKRVAIKVLKPGAATDASHVKRLVAEAEAVNAIGHRHIVDIFGLGQLDDGRPYIVMEFLEGEPFDAYLRRCGRLPLHEVLGVLIDILSPLAAAHAKGVIHRDLKPSNVFRCGDVESGHYLKLLDFGLAKKAMDGATAQSSQHVVAGTPDYMAPEQARAMPVSARTDLYALGVMAYEMISGEVPYIGQTPMDVMMAHVSAPVPSVAALVPTTPPALDQLVRRLMAKNPNERPSSAADVRAELRALASGLSPTGTYLRLEPTAQRTSSSSETPVVRGPVTEYRPAVPALPEVAAPAPVAQPRSRLPVVVVSAVVLVGAAGLWFSRTPTVVEPPLDIAPTRPVAVVPPVVPPPVVPPPVAVTPPPVVPAPEVVKEPEPPKVDRPRVKGAPTAEQLSARVERLERDWKHALKGASGDPGTEKLLRRYRLRATAVSTVEERAELDRDLTTFERSVIAPLR